mmetsp:Transcript_90682/g.259080  ORF Transcript_90682/g.259080 Transcript_90682/m.259080 type:complete len:267 (-) Transcript_90682:33-833(-)
MGEAQSKGAPGGAAIAAAAKFKAAQGDHQSQGEGGSESSPDVAPAKAVTGRSGGGGSFRLKSHAQNTPPGGLHIRRRIKRAKVMTEPNFEDVSIGGEPRAREDLLDLKKKNEDIFVLELRQSDKISDVMISLCLQLYGSPLAPHGFIPLLWGKPADEVPLEPNLSLDDYGVKLGADSTLWLSWELPSPSQMAKPHVNIIFYPEDSVRCMKVEPGDLSFKNVEGNIRNKLDLRGHENDEWFLVDEATRKPLKEGDVVDSGALLYLVV